MAYQTGTSANADQLLDALRVFAVANGWTQLRWAPDGTGQTLSLAKGGLYVHLRSAVNERLSTRYNTITGIWLIGSTGFDAGKPWWDQPGSIVNASYVSNTTSYRAEACGLFEVGTANTYHLLSAATPELIMCVAEVSPGVYHHLAFGELTKFGSYGGGAFVSGAFGPDAYTYTYSGFNDYVFGYDHDRHFGLPFNDYKYYGGANFVLAEVDGATDWHSVCKDWALTGKRAKALWERGTGTPRDSLARYWWGHVPNTLNGVTPMLPFYLFVARPSGFFSPFGHTAHLRYLNITHYAPAEAFALGAEQWMAFPAHSKNGKSGVHGYAVRLIP
ncbi:hypothetical protein [Dyella sedimenti]|uniref:hypothetical protein n=1 Tax=Dyella sedimenti TaxID=2919947 RepID=UPI001FAB0E22|nr:hypothetical protein [Dyella sedimenti]